MDSAKFMQVAEAMAHSITNSSYLIFLQGSFMDLNDVRGRSETVLHNQPSYIVTQVATLVLYGIGVLQLSQEPDLLEDVLPLLQTLLAQVAHLLDGDNLLGEQTSGVVDGPETAVADLTQVLENLLGIMLVEQVCDLRISKTPRPGHRSHCCSA